MASSPSSWPAHPGHEHAPFSKRAVLQRSGPKCCRVCRAGRVSVARDRRLCAPPMSLVPSSRPAHEASARAEIGKVVSWCGSGTLQHVASCTEPVGFALSVCGAAGLGAESAWRSAPEPPTARLRLCRAWLGARPWAEKMMVLLVFWTCWFHFRRPPRNHRGRTTETSGDLVF